MLLGRIRKLLALSHSERFLLARAFVDLTLVEFGLRLFGFQRVMRRIESETTAGNRTVDAHHWRRTRDYTRWLETASQHHPSRVRCLHRSVALHRWLRREGLPSELRIGVLKEDGTLRAHAWVELGGKVVNDPPASVMPFTPLVQTAMQDSMPMRAVTDPAVVRPGDLGIQDIR